MNTRTLNNKCNFVCQIRKDMQEQMEEIKKDTDVNWSYLVREFLKEKITELKKEK